MNAPLSIRPQDGFKAGRPWSLWDMLRVYAKPFVEASELIGQLIGATLDPRANSWSDQYLEWINERIDLLIEQLRILGLTMTIQSAQRFKNHINLPGITPRQCRDYLIQLRDRLPDELDTTFLLSLSRAESELFEPAAPRWGAAVAAQFANMQDEIDEAGKCLALGRFTACAFHSLRCLEGGILAMSRCLSIPDPTRGHDRNWSAMLQKIKDACGSKWTAQARMHGDGQLFEEMYAALAGMQNPWRNSTMHLEHSFSEEQAIHVFEVVAGFMRRLAERMDENGNPLA